MYQKIIQSGTLIEVYEYEKSPPEFRPRKKRRKGAYGKRYIRNITRARNSFFRLVRANLKRNSSVAFLTLTMRECDNIRDGWRLFTRFSQKVRKDREVAPSDACFIAVPEFQKRGAVHFHCLVWGLADELPCLASNIFYRDATGKRKRKHICPSQRACEKQSRRIAKLWGHGFVDCFTTDNDPRLATYMAKYMQKSMSDARTVGTKSYSASRRLVRSVHLKGNFQSDIAKIVFGISPSEECGDKLVEPEVVREYNTQWLGRAKYSSYNIDK